MKKFFVFLLVVVSCLPAYSSTDLNSQQALQSLKDGNARFVNGTRTYPNQSQARRSQTAEKGQHPYATVIACSDSRVPVEELFDAGIGDIFTIRVAGNVVDVDEAGSIEYGVEHLKTPVLVVLGHSGCGAVTAVCQHAEVHGNIPQLVDNIMPAAEKARNVHGQTFSAALLETAIDNNVWQSVEDLLRISHITAELVKSGQLKIVGAVYHLDDGRVEWLGEHPNQGTLLQQATAHTSANHVSTETSRRTTGRNQYGSGNRAGTVQVTETSNLFVWLFLSLIGFTLLVYFLLINKNTALKLNLKGNILSLAVVTLVLIVALAFVNMASLQKIGEKLENIATEDIVLTEYIAEIEKHTLEQEVVLQKTLTLAHDGVYRNKAEIASLEKDFNDLSEEIDEHIDEGLVLCNDVLKHETDAAQLQEFSWVAEQFSYLDEEHDVFEEHVTEMFSIVNANLLSELEKIEHSIEEEGAVIAHQVADVLENIEKFTKAAAGQAVKVEEDAFLLNIILSISVLLLGIVLGLVIANKIASQLGGEPEEVAEISNKMALGDLSFDVAAYGKRKGAMYHLLQMCDRLKVVVGTIITGADNIAAASNQLSSASQQVSSGVSEQAASAEEVSSSMEEMAANIQQNTENSAKTRDISAKSSNAMEQMAVASDESMNAVRDIYSKINIVVEIAEKTDLLAINAAVEAARAGEQGKGFAVVAAEVRKLAERSQAAANEIVQLADKGLKLTEESTGMLKKIVPDIQETSRLVEEISVSSQEQDAGANQVNSAIQQLSMVTQQNASSSEEMAGSSEELASQAAELKEIVAHFKLQDEKRKSFGRYASSAKTNLVTNKHSNNGSHADFPQQRIDISMSDSDLNNYESM
jgi:methyl-accepting chemotaxis protein